MTIDHTACDPKYGHVCRSKKAANAAALIIAAWRSAGDEGMSKAQTLAHTGLDSKWFHAGRVYIRLHAAAMLNRDEPYTYDSRANGGHGAYHLNASDDRVLDYLAKEFVADAERLERRMNTALLKVKARATMTSVGEQWLEQLIDYQRGVIRWAKFWSAQIDNPAMRAVLLQQLQQSNASSMATVDD